MYKCLFSNGFPPPPCPDPPSMAIAPAPSTLYIMYRKSLCMVEGGGAASESWGTPFPLPASLPSQAKIFAKGHSLPRAFGVGWEGEKHLVNYF